MLSLMLVCLYNSSECHSDYHLQDLSVSLISVAGWLPLAEILKNVNMMELTISSDVAGTDSVCKTRLYLLAVVSPSGTRKKLHSRKLSVVVHVNSN